MSIGRFARRSGLSIGALRHYAEIGLLVPARVDPDTGYRYYRDDQLPTGRRIAALRALEVPLAVIREVRDATPEVLAARLTRHRAEIEAKIWRLQGQAHRLLHYEPDKETTMPTSAFRLDPDDERRLAASLFNGVWDLLERPDRSEADNDAMLHGAHASRHHWGVVGEPVNWARGEWQISRVYAVLCRAEPALHHARRYLALVTEHRLEPFDLGYAHEAHARAFMVAARPADQAHHVGLARTAADGITDAEERELLLQDLAQLDGAPPQPPPQPLPPTA